MKSNVLDEPYRRRGEPIKCDGPHDWVEDRRSALRGGDGVEGDAPIWICMHCDEWRAALPCPVCDTLLLPEVLECPDCAGAQ